MSDINLNLIRRCKNREPEAFHLLLSRQEAYLYRLCFSYLHNKEDTLDVIQEVFLKVFNNIAAFDESRDFLPWLKKIAVNSCLNYLRAKHRKDHLSLDYAPDSEWNPFEFIPASDDVEGAVLEKSLKDSLRQCLKKLPPNQRMVLTLHYLEEMSCQEIAELLEQPIGTVKSNLFRARALLKNAVSEKGLLEA